MKKHLIIVCTCRKEIKEALVDKLIETLFDSNSVIDKYDDDYFGIRREDGTLNWDFLKTTEGRGNIIVTSSSETVRQINMAILRGELEKSGKEIPESCNDIPSLMKEDIEVFGINRKGEAKEIEVEERGIGMKEMDDMIEEINTKTEDLYYTLKYGT